MAILNINAITVTAFLELEKLDRTYRGTLDYMGLAYFWAHEYKHSLRDASYSKRRRVHHAFLKAGLDPSGVSDEHRKIIRRILGRYSKTLGWEI